MPNKRKSDTPNSEHKLKKSKIENNVSDDESDVKHDDNPGRAGRILNVQLKNFMCHASLEVDLNQNVNYIIGRNGSGKSAILTALIVGLGGKAAATNRGTSMKSFIKSGQSSAQVDITITNTGSLAYRPDLFGQKIIVSRIFNETASRYKLKNEHGKVVSTQFREVRRLIEALNIQVDNPICILNQDTARTFLNTNDTTKKYQMFMKATNLESINEQYQLSLKHKQHTHATLRLRKSNLVRLKTESDKWLQKVEAIESLDELQKRKNMLMTEVMWAKVHEEHTIMEEKEKEFLEAQKEMENLESSTLNKHKQKTDLLANKEAYQNQLREIKTEFETNQKEMDVIKLKCHKIKENIFTKTKSIDGLKTLIDRKTGDKKVIESELKNIEANQPNRQKLIEARARRLDELQNKLQLNTDLIGTTENDLMQTRNALQLKMTEEKSIETELKHFERNISQLQSQIHSFKSESDNSVKVYGKNMPRVLSAIQNAKEQFLKLPIGPLGSYIKLKDKKWAVAIEGIIGAGNLEAFCVDNNRDSKLLNDIFDSVYGKKAPRPTIICSKFFNKVHNIAPNKTHVPNGCTALIDALNISNPVVSNCLIDQLSIETLLLTPSGEVSMSLMSRRENVPKNCSRAITIKGDQFYPDPAYRTYAGRWKVARFLQVNTGELVKQYESELQSSQRKAETVRQQQIVILKNMKEFKSSAMILDDKLNSLNRNKVKLQDIIEETRSEEIPTEKNVDIYKNEMGEIDKYIEEKNHAINEILNEIKDVQGGYEEIRNQLIVLKKNAKSFDERIEPLMTEIDKIQEQVNQLDKSSKYKVERLARFKMQINDLKVQLDNNIKKFEEQKEYALQAGTQPETVRNLPEVIHDIREVDERLEQARSVIGDAEAARNTYQRINVKYINVKDLIDSVQRSLDALTKAMTLRSRQYHRLVQQTGVSVREMFSGVLKVRQFSGSIEIDHDQKTLELIVAPAHGSQHSGAKHILSGGERSYSTVAFLMSLWQVMEYPFYFLDEFDVFMDKVNRRVIMDMLLDHGLEHKNLQYVFLTPQDISSVDINDNVTIHRMNDPERKAIQNGYSHS